MRKYTEIRRLYTIALCNFDRSGRHSSRSFYDFTSSAFVQYLHMMIEKNDIGGWVLHTVVRSTPGGGVDSSGESTIGERASGEKRKRYRYGMILF